MFEKNPSPVPIAETAALNKLVDIESAPESPTKRAERIVAEKFRALDPDDLLKENPYVSF